ncbi:uncharacterized protein B0T15DRAFT_206699 [Chaetomium strumarium]|uniref:SET domain-containing protein n=1 Tax=Chaetomium strumarium TaxID=1170767 RepID=A0AAJ0GT74_9PEZI|nr:hypothetical protein B0T15DRAFT_206699 [Chaetomium strumarium]
MASHDGNTVFLTEQEAERIRTTVKDRLKKCDGLVGHAREPRDKKTAISSATGAALMADMANMGPSKGATMPAIGLGQPYPPCVTPFKDLQPMKLSDLRMESHHRGHRLTVKRASPVVKLAARSWTMVQDEAGEEAERLELCLHKMRHGKELLELADSAFIIKEPYFTLTDDGEPTIRIDHPSDLVVVPESEAWSINGTNGEPTDAAAAEQKARSCKDQGNSALEKLNFALAHARYSEGLRVARQDIVYNTNPDLARDLSRNRAHVNLLLSQLDEAKADAKASLIGKEDDPRSRELDIKAFFRAGMAAYHLGDYHEAKELFEQRLKLTLDINPKETQTVLRRIVTHLGEQTQAILRRIETRLREQEAGTHDLKKIRAGLSRARPRVEAASFVGQTAVKDSPGRGRGLFTTRDVAAGEIVMLEKAFCVVWGFESDALTAITYDVRDDRIRVSPAGLTRAVVQKLLSNPSQIEKVMDMYGDWQGDSNTKNVFSTDDGPVVDTFRVHDIVSRNAFGPGSQYGEKGAQDASTGLWIRAGYTNHSCLANVHKEYVGDLMVLRATRAIAAGEEIFHSYDESSDYEARQRALMHTWGFECECPLCVVEKAEDPAVRKKRRELAAEADAFVQKEPWANANRRIIVRAQRLARAIEETYDGEKYKGLPRLATKSIQEWLAHATARR